MANNLVSTGAPVTYDTTGQKFGTGALINGTLATPVTMSVLLGATGTFTAEAWVYYTGGASGGPSLIYGSISTFWVGVKNGVWIANYGAGNNNTITSTATVVPNIWHHVAIVFGASATTIYVDGVSVVTSSVTLASQAPNYGTALGVGGFSGTGYPFIGDIDEAAIFVGERYSASFTPPASAYVGNETNLKALYHLDSNGNDNSGASGTPTPAPTPTPTPTPGQIAANDSNIVYAPGVWDVTSVRAKTINPGAYFRLLIQGTATSITLNFDVSADLTPLPQVRARVDRGPWVVQEIAASMALTIPTGPTATVHLVEFEVKSSTQQQARWLPQATAISFLGIAVAPSTCSTMPIQASPLKGLVFGDSITEGVRTLGSTTGRDTDANDAGLGWALALRDLLGAEIGVVGFGGTGFLTAHSDVPATTATYGLLWDSSPARSFAGVTFIVINLGTNDGVNITPAATALLNGLLTAAPGARIFVMRPLNGYNGNGLPPAIAACNNPGLCTFVDTTGWWSSADSSDGLHPYGYADLTQIAPRLAAAVRTGMASVSAVTNRWTHR